MCKTKYFQTYSIAGSSKFLSKPFLRPRQARLAKCKLLTDTLTENCNSHSFLSIQTTTFGSFSPFPTPLVHHVLIHARVRVKLRRPQSIMGYGTPRLLIFFFIFF